jgi:hypothetical protein
MVKSRKGNKNMETAIVIWVIGWLFTLGVIDGQVSKESATASFFFSLMFWPVMLDGYVDEKLN